MPKQKKTKEVGTVIESHPHMFDVELENGDVIKAYPSGKITQNQIEILPGDKVEVEVSPYGENGRIIYRIT